MQDLQFSCVSMVQYELANNTHLRPTGESLRIIRPLALRLVPKSGPSWQSLFLLSVQAHGLHIVLFRVAPFPLCLPTVSYAAAEHGVLLAFRIRG